MNVKKKYVMLKEANRLSLRDKNTIQYYWYLTFPNPSDSPQGNIVNRMPH